MTFELVLFDLDGTLVDSVPSIQASIRAATSSLALPEPTPEQLTAMVGPPLHDGFVEVLGLQGPLVEQAVAAYRAHCTAGAMLEAPVYPGVRELLQDLLDQGRTLAVATSKPAPFARRILEHVGLTGCFASTHGADLDGSVRHEDEVVGLALGAHPDERALALVGDRAQDVAGAAAHGLPCIGAGWGPAPPGELLRAGAAAVCATPAEVLTALVAVRREEHATGGSPQP